MEESLVVCTGIITLFALLFGFILLMRFLAYRETIALAEKGLIKQFRERNGGKGALVWGLIITALGIALTIGLWPLGFTGFGTPFPLGFGPWMLAGLVPLFFGLALVLIYVFTRDEKKNGTEPEALPTMTTEETTIDEE